MKNQSISVCAAIDIGSNTVHVVVARCMPNNLEILADEQALVRIGESVTATGEISPQKCEAAITVLCSYKALAEQYAASPILVVATEAIRQAKNREAFIARVWQDTGLEVQLIAGDVEALLTFYGATCDLSQEPRVPARIGVMDLGGGSLELVLAKHMQIAWRTSVPIGSGWLYDRYLATNPPTQDDFSVAQTFLLTYFQGVRLKPRPPLLIVTGGSANTLLRLARQAFQFDEQEMRLTYDDVLRCEGLLRALPAQEIAERYHLAEARAKILPAGALIIHTVMLWLHLREIYVSSHGIREGALLAYARYGPAWLECLQASTSGRAGEGEIDAEQVYDDTVANEAFAHSGHQMLRERTRKMFAWRADVLKHEDSEAVHRMRVASRRLRAVLDAYESACNPKLFKKAYRRVRSLADRLGKARDTDVMIAHLCTRQGQVSSEEQIGIDWLVERLRAYRDEEQGLLASFLTQINTDTWERKVLACLPAEGAEHGKSQTNY